MRGTVLNSLLSKRDKGTVVRTVLLFIALVNQTLIMFGKSALPISEDQVNTLADALYLAGSTIFTIVTTLVAWYKNNYVKTTDRHDQQIISINEKLNKIEENTTWIKRSITGAIITAVSTGIIGGAIAVFYNLLQK
ncbi:phage holin [Bacillus licheniformis]|nr:phage holin [Bacillus licheniformis]